MKIFIAELPLLLLCLPKNKIGSAAAVILFFAAGLLLSTRNKSSANDFSFEEAVLAMYISITGGIFFYIRWQNTARMANIASLLAMPARQFCAVVTTGLCTCACFSLIYLLHNSPFRESMQKHQKSADILFILLLAAGTITQTDYNTRVRAAEDARTAVQNADLALFSAMETYDWSVNGLAAAE